MQLETSAQEQRKFHLKDSTVEVAARYPIVGIWHMQGGETREVIEILREICESIGFKIIISLTSLYAAYSLVFNISPPAHCP